MEKGRHPNVIRTWAVDRIRHQTHPPVQPLPSSPPRAPKTAAPKPASKPKKQG